MEVTVALSGTLDTFALPDVLRLLASTEKTGRLRVSGPRGSGSLWVDGGEVVATEVASTNALEPTDIEVVFGLLRFEAGTFTFENDAVASNASSASSMEPLLEAAEKMLAEWRSIEEVVPSLEVWVALSPELNGPDVMIDSQRWRCIAAVGSGVQVGLVAETLRLNEVGACQLVKELIELGLLQKIDVPISAASVDGPGPEAFEADSESLGTDAEIGDGLGVVDQRETDDAPDNGSPSFIDEVFAEPSPFPIPVSPASSGAATNGDPCPAEVDSMFDVATEAEADADDLDPAEMARQLANLSPKAAKAVAAAAKATTDVEREAALVALEAEDRSVNRGLLLKFLGSVDL